MQEEEREKVARRKAGATGRNYMEWLEALSEGDFLSAAAHLERRQLMALVDAAATPIQLKLIAAALDEQEREHPRDHRSAFAQLVCHVDESAYGLAEWLEAIEYFYGWLDLNNRQAGFTAILEYLGCCSEATPDGVRRPKLRDLLEEMLDEYGMEA